MLLCFLEELRQLVVLVNSVNLVIVKSCSQLCLSAVIVLAAMQMCVDGFVYTEQGTPLLDKLGNL